MMGEVSEDPSSHCQRLQKEAEFSPFDDWWYAQDEAGIDTVDGALGPHYCATVGRISRSGIISHNPIL